MITPVDGVRVGHWTGEGTGVTVCTTPEGTVGSVEVRGGAPASRELAALEPGRLVERVDAVVLTGGSAFGLAAADGVVRTLAANGLGFPTAGGPVPIVPALAIYDLVASGGHPPGPAEGVAALADAAGESALVRGRVGAGTGARVGKWRGAEHEVPGGLGAAVRAVGEATVLAIAVVNAVGDVVDASGEKLAGSTAPPDAPAFPEPEPFMAGEHTTLVVLATDGRLSRAECHRLAQSATDGRARALRPSHTLVDGDATVALATGRRPAHVERLRVEAADAVAAAVRDAVR